MEHEAPGYRTRDNGMGQKTPGWDTRPWDGAQGDRMGHGTLGWNGRSWDGTAATGKGHETGQQEPGGNSTGGHGAPGWDRRPWDGTQGDRWGHRMMRMGWDGMSWNRTEATGMGHEVPGGDMRWDTRHQDEIGSARMEHRAPGWDSSHWDGTGGVKRRQEVSG